MAAARAAPSHRIELLVAARSPPAMIALDRAIATTEVMMEIVVLTATSGAHTHHVHPCVSHVRSTLV
jgi:hypothetical protein